MVAHAHTVRNAQNARSRGARKYLIKNKKVGHAGVVVYEFETHRATRTLATINHDASPTTRASRGWLRARARDAATAAARDRGARAMATRRALASRARMVVVPFGGAATSSTSTTTREGHRWMAHGAAVVEPAEARAREAMGRADDANGTMATRAMRTIDRAMPWARRWGARAVDYGEKTWRAMAASAPGSARRRIHELGMFAMDRIDPRERALKEMPKILSSVEIVYPSGVDVGAVRRLVERTVVDGTKNARAATTMYALGAPLSMPMFLTPVSNFPLYYFLFRLWSSTQATTSGKEAIRLLKTTDEAAAKAVEADVLGSTRVVECKRLRPINVLNSDTGREVSTMDEPHAMACCRLSQPGGEKFLGDEGPRVLFVPCDALAKVVREYHGVDDATATQQCASATVERLFGASGVVDLARSHKRYDEIYGVKDESALR